MTPPPATNVDTMLARLSQRYGFAPDRIDTPALSRLVDTLDEAGLDIGQAQTAILAAATVGETHFLRHRAHFDWLERMWLPARLRRSEPAPLHLRVLSAGCATGEEAYSVAAVLLRGVAGHPAASIDVVGVDINEDSLRRARDAVYGCWSLRGLDLENESSWLETVGGQVRVCRAVRDCVRFERHNILEPFPNGPFDLVICRNVLIYFFLRAVRRAYENLRTCLADDGLLLVGPADPSPPPSTGLRLHWAGDVRLYGLPLTGDATPSELDARERSDDPPQKRVDGAKAAPGGGATQPDPAASRDMPAPSASDDGALVRRVSRMAPSPVALELLLHHLRREPLDVAAQLLAAQHASELRDSRLAFECVRRATFLAPTAPYVVFVAADLCERAGRVQQASRYFRWTEDLLSRRRDDEHLAYSEGLVAKQLREVLDARKRQAS